jgi:AcrR family transcriptional regulator
VDMTRSPEPILSRERIVAVALRLLDEDGLSGLSTRRIAAELGITSSALYYHFDSMDDIVAGVVHEVMRSMSEPDPASHWTAQVTLLSRSYRDTLIAHPNLSPAMLRHPYRRFGGSVVASLTRAMAADGIPATIIPEVLGSFEFYVFGAGIFAQTRYESPRPDSMAELDGFPDVARALLAAQDSDASFEGGLQSLIDGWQARISSLRMHPPANDRTEPVDPNLESRKNLRSG